MVESCVVVPWDSKFADILQIFVVIGPSERPCFATVLETRKIGFSREILRFVIKWKLANFLILFLCEKLNFAEKIVTLR